MSKNLNSVITSFILIIKIKSKHLDLLETWIMMNIECMLNVIHHNLMKCLNKIKNIHSWKFAKIFFNDNSMQLHKTILLDLNIQNFNESNLCILKIFIIVEYISENFMLNLSFFEKHNFIHEFAHQHLRWRILCTQNKRNRLSHWKTVSKSFYMMFNEAKLASSLFACNIHQPSFMKKVILKFFHWCNHQREREVSSAQLTQNLKQQSIIIHIQLLLNALYDFLNFSVKEENFQLTQIENMIIDQFLNVLKEFMNFANFFTQKVKVLSTHEFHDHAICIKKSRIALWDFLYNLFAVELIAQKAYIEKQLQANMIQYFIFSVEMFMLFTSKKDETLQSCVNYQKLNAIILKNRCLLSLINEALDHLADVKWFIKLDIKNAFNKLCIWEEDKWKMTFHTRFNLYKYLVMLFDLINASTFFQIYMNQTLFKFLDIIYLIYLNDILIFNKIRKKHVHHVQQILDKLQILKLYIKLFKCKFFKKELFFLKYKVEKREISMKKNWVQIIQDWSQ